MKKLLALVFIVIAARSQCRAQFVVLDVANLAQSIINYAAMVEEVAKEAQQIENQIQQIKQMEDQLKRMGSMADFKALIGFPEFKLDLNLPTKIRTWAENVAGVNGTGLLGDTRDGIFQAVSSEFPSFDGAPVARDPVVYKPAHEITSQVDDFKVVQADVFARREELKKGIRETSDALQASETEAEEQKLSAVLGAQYSQLAALDSEVSMSASEVQVKVAQATAMATAQGEADSEARGKLSQQEVKKVTTTFTPTYECLLQFVSEKPFTP